MDKDQPQTVCTFPNCSAAVFLDAYKTSVDDLKAELRLLHDDQKMILQAINMQGSLQTSIENITKRLEAAYLEHEDLFRRMREMESTVKVNANRLGVLETSKKDSLDWIWDFFKLAIVAGIAAWLTHVLG